MDTIRDKLTASVMRKISRGTISRAEAALRLQVSARSVNRLMKKYGVKRPERPKGIYRTRHEAALARREQQKEAVRKVRDWHQVPDVARQLGLSERQVFRLIKKYRESA